MATRSFIGIYDGRNKSVEYIYCHNDGSLEWVGANLINYYNDERTIRALLRKGSLSSLHPEIDTCTLLHDYEPSMKIDNVKTIHEAFYQMYEESIEYMYLYDKDSRKWYYMSGVPSMSTKGKVLPDMKSSENFDSLKDAIAYINGVLDRNGGFVDIAKKRIDMKDNEGRYYDITTIEKDGRDVVISTEQGKTFILSDLKKPIQWSILNNLKSYRVERRGFRFQKHESVFKKSRKMESISDDSHNLWYSFATDIEAMLQEHGIYCDIWINDMGYMEISNENGDTCVLYTKVVPDGRFMSQQLMIEQEDGGFKPGEVFDTGEQPRADKLIDELLRLDPLRDADEGKCKARRKRCKSTR